jgi:hypothetical protein
VLQVACGLALVFAVIELPLGIGSAAWAAITVTGLGSLRRQPAARAFRRGKSAIKAAEVAREAYQKMSFSPNCMMRGSRAEGNGTERRTRVQPVCSR